MHDLGGSVLKSVKTENSRADFASSKLLTVARRIGDSSDIRHCIESAPLLNMKLITIYKKNIHKITLTALLTSIKILYPDFFLYKY